MRKLAAVLIFGVAVLWSTMAWAQYSALGEDPEYGPWIGLGGIYLSGDNGAGDSDSEVVPTVNIAGLTDFVAWQLFYGFGTESTVIGGNIDYIFADNFDECYTCPDQGSWWFGAGLSAMDVSDLYFDDVNALAAVEDTYFGGNVGFGYIMDDWAFNLYVHMFDSQMAVQGMFLYDFGG